MSNVQAEGTEVEPKEEHDSPPRENSIETRDSDSSSAQLDLLGLRICQIIVPVTLCSFYVLILIRILEFRVVKSTTIKNIWWQFGIDSAKAGEETFLTDLLNNILIGLAVILLIVSMTLLMLFVFYMGWHRYLLYYFYLPSLVVMAVVTPITFVSVLQTFNVAFDWITLTLMVWNFAFLGMISVFGVFMMAPLYAQQFYLIHNSALLAVLIIHILPGWAPWLILVILVFWDLFAVLAPIGPLNLIIGMAEKEGVVEMPGLIYSTDVNESNGSQSKPRQVQAKEQRNQQPEVEESKKKPSSKRKKNQIDTIESNDSGGKAGLEANKEENMATRERNQEDSKTISPEGSSRKNMEERGVNIGLGDFIFYSLLIGLTVKNPTTNNYYTALAALVGILFGLIVTLVFLSRIRRALPALPVSIILALFVSAATAYFVPDFSNRLATEQIFV